MTVFGPALRVPGTFLGAHLCCQTLMGLLFLSALLAKPCSHRDNEGLICLQQYGAFLHSLHVFFKALTLSNEVRILGQGLAADTWKPRLDALSSSTPLQPRMKKVSCYPGFGRHLLRRELGLLWMTGCI